MVRTDDKRTPREKLMDALENPPPTALVHLTKGMDYAEIAELTALDRQGSIYESPAAKEILIQPVRDFAEQLSDEAITTIVRRIENKRKTILEATQRKDPVTRAPVDGMHVPETLAVAAVLLYQDRISIEDFGVDKFRTNWWMEQLSKDHNTSEKGR